MPDQYLQQYAEAEARALLASPPTGQWDQVLVIPAYREAADWLEQLRDQLQLQRPTSNQKPANTPDTGLVIVVLNQPAGLAQDSNAGLRNAITALPEAQASAVGTLYTLAPTVDILLLERPTGLPAREGVGLARKIGCDCALALQHRGNITSHWIHNTDADAILPADYFYRANRVQDHCAISHPFYHQAAQDPALAEALALYDLRLRYYVYGLASAASPYAFHTLGSCISVDAQCYARVRGFPRRAGGEDFYLLNKLAKLGPIASPTAPLITLQGRSSDRVPFGTGPAVNKLIAQGNASGARLFYHPESFRALGTLLAALPGLAKTAPLQDIASLSEPAQEILQGMGIEAALDHCHRQARDEQAWIKHFHQWFDGFRTLKFIHGLRAAGWEDMSLKDSRAHPASIWPG